MIFTGPGTFFLHLKERAPSQSIDWASMSASEPSFFKTYCDDELVEDAFIGPYGSPHTWWPASNPLLGRCALTKDMIIRIELGPGVKFRIEGDLVEVSR